VEAPTNKRKNMWESSHEDRPIRRVVVGVDGSPASEAALRWAIREAAAHNADLDVVHAFRAPTGPIRGPNPGYLDATWCMMASLS
jgi:K+-sensing histidine kinase KdpD